MLNCEGELSHPFIDGLGVNVGLVLVGHEIQELVGLVLTGTGVVPVLLSSSAVLPVLVQQLSVTEAGI